MRTHQKISVDGLDKPDFCLLLLRRVMDLRVLLDWLLTLRNMVFRQYVEMPSFNDGQERDIYRLCTMREVETISHILTECPGVVDQRSDLWSQLSTAIGYEVCVHVRDLFESFTSTQKAWFLSGGLPIGLQDELRTTGLSAFDRERLVRKLARWIWDSGQAL